MTELSTYLQRLVYLVHDAPLFPSSIQGGRHTGNGKLKVR